MKKLLPIIILLFTFSAIAFGQSDKPQPNQWKGLTIDKSTADQVSEKLGTPNKDSKEKIYSMKSGWLTKTANDKIWRTLQYKNIEGFSEVKLSFKDDKLVWLQLNPKDLTAQAFTNAYDLDFRFTDDVRTPNDFKTEVDDKKSRSLGAWYELVGVTPDVFVFAGIGNAFGSVADFYSLSRKPKLSGKVKLIYIASRTLENKDNVDILK